MTRSTRSQAGRTVHILHAVIDFRWSTTAGTVWAGHRAAATDVEMAGNNPEHCYDELESQLPSLHSIL